MLPNRPRRRAPRCMTRPPALPTGPRRRPAPRNALLIMPFYAKETRGSYGKHVLTPTLALSTVAAATPGGWDVRIWDESLLQGPPPCDPLPAIVGISVHLTSVRRSCELADWYMAQGSTVILGGPHMECCGDEAAAHADAIATGDGTVTWPQILRDFETGRLKPRYDAGYLSPFADAPIPRRQLIPRQSFLTTASLTATRGCRNRCSFCYLSTGGLRMPYQERPPEMVAAEFDAIGEPYGVFVDNNLGANPDYLATLCRELRKLDKIWSAAVTIDLANRPDVVREMARAGCTGVFVGFETLNAANLQHANKRTSLPDDYARQVEVFHRHGIQVNGSFVFGFDHDDGGVFDRTLAWIETNRLECATFHILTPYPGTPFFRQLDEEGRLLHKDWTRYDTAHCVFQPKLMTPDELEAGYARCYRELFSLPSIWRRRPAVTRQIPGYLAMSLLYKKTNWLWPWLIRHQLAHRFWQPLIRAAQWQHVRSRRRQEAAQPGKTCGAPVSPGV